MKIKKETEKEKKKKPNYVLDESVANIEICGTQNIYFLKTLLLLLAMEDSSQNPYKICRNQASITQEKALHSSPTEKAKYPKKKKKY